MTWIDELKSPSKVGLWDNFRPAGERELESLEQQLGRVLPADFREFYREIGYGHWPDRYGGGIYSPEEILEIVGAPVYFVLGSMTPGKEWATAAQHRELWLTRGGSNPDPRRFTDQALRFRGMSLLDLLEIGSDGSAGYQMLNLERSAETKYLLIYESTQVEFASKSFREGITRITDWQTREGDDA